MYVNCEHLGGMVGSPGKEAVHARAVESSTVGNRERTEKQNRLEEERLADCQNVSVSFSFRMPFSVHTRIGGDLVLVHAGICMKGRRGKEAPGDRAVDRACVY